MSTKVVKCILEKPFLGQRPIVANSLESNVESLSILLNIKSEIKKIKNQNYYIIGDVFYQVDCRHETIHGEYTWLQVDNCQISKKLELFPYSFSHGNNGYDRNISFSEYIHCVHNV